VELTWVIAWREVNAILRQRRMVLFAVGFGVVMPLLAGAGFVGVVVRLSTVVGLATLGHVQASLHVTDLQKLVQSMLVWLGIFPIMFSAQFAAIAFATERERRSLPALLATPAPLDAMILGKLVASLLPGFATLIAAYSVFFAAATTVAPVVRVWLPLGTVVAAALFLVALSVLVNGAALLISARAKTVMGASSTVTFVSLPVSVGTAIFAVTMDTLGPLAVADAAIAIAAIAALILWLGNALWKRGEILAG
jgi:ABC-type Na+ efflux pump permease subunit